MSGMQNRGGDQSGRHKLGGPTSGPRPVDIRERLRRRGQEALVPPKLEQEKELALAAGAHTIGLGRKKQVKPIFSQAEVGANAERFLKDAQVANEGKGLESKKMNMVLIAKLISRTAYVDQFRHALREALGADIQIEVAPYYSQGKPRGTNVTVSGLTPVHLERLRIIRDRPNLPVEDITAT